MDNIPFGCHAMMHEQSLTSSTIGTDGKRSGEGSW